MKLQLLPLDQIDPYQLAYHANDIQISKYLRNSFPYPYTIEHALSYIQFSIQHHHIEFGIVVDDICVGCIGVTLQKDIYETTCELGYWLSSLYWNKGIMSQVVPHMCQFLFENYNIHKIYAQVFKENKASAHLLEKCHFIKEGHFHEHVFKDGCYHDIICYGLLGGIYED